MGILQEFLPDSFYEIIYTFKPEKIMVNQNTKSLEDQGQDI